VPRHVSASINAVAQTQEISVPDPVADVTVMALDSVLSILEIMNLFVLRTTVSNFQVRDLIAVCILVAICAIVVSVEKFNHVIDLATPSIAK